MTHTLHRRGDHRSLCEDYVMLILPAKGVNEEGAQQKMEQIWDLLSQHESDLVNFGNITEGNSHLTRIETLKHAPCRMVHAVFKDREKLKTCLEEIKEGNFGLSVVISGLHEEVEKICSEVGLLPHTVEHSLGIHGNRERLPGENVLEITTMCGHALVSPNLVSHLLKEIEEGRLSHGEGAKELSKQCRCGIFNPYRAKRLLRRLTPTPS